MATPTELSLDEIRNFIELRGGKVTNHDLVKHFKSFLTNPATRDEARETFKKYVNILGSIKNENGEKYIVLKKKKNSVVSPDVSTSDVSRSFSPSTPPTPTFFESQVTREPPPYIPPPVVSPKSPIKILAAPFEMSNAPPIPKIQDSLHSPPVMTSHSKIKPVEEKFVPAFPPVVPDPENDIVLRRNQSSFDSIPVEKKHMIGSQSYDNVNMQQSQHIGVKKLKKDPDVGLRQNVESETDGRENGMSTRSSSSRSLNSETEHISVKERLERFNKLTTDGDFIRRQPLMKKKLGGEDEDRVSMLSLSPSGHEWILKAAVCDYPALAKMLIDDPNLVKVKDPASGTAVHWAAKHGNEDIVKLCSGKYSKIVNQRSNGGYTPLHIAMQFNNEGIYNLLIVAYGADRNIRDWSGKKPRQYQVNSDTSVSDDTYQRLMEKKKQTDQKFLRIGSLNLRVKKTTNALGNLLGVSVSTKAKSIMKSWGSAENIQGDKVTMPPPQTAVVKRRAYKSKGDNIPSQNRSTPCTPNQTRSLVPGEGCEFIYISPSNSPQQDSDSDSVCGFDAQWHNKKT